MGYDWRFSKAEDDIHPNSRSSGVSIKLNSKTKILTHYNKNDKSKVYVQNPKSNMIKERVSYVEFPIYSMYFPYIIDISYLMRIATV